ncbi:transposase [Streptomyces sp. NPDC047042]|uniref:transposase n=1 Tax=Streptomyces sp. NPDC047042 TaxID=3154807 RepID=UPI00340C15FF
MDTARSAAPARAELTVLTDFDQDLAAEAIYGSPAAPRKAGRHRLVELIRPKAPRMATRLIDDVFDALDEQTVVVPGTGTGTGTGTLDIVIPSLACRLTAVHTQRRATEAQIKALLEAHPLSPVLTSMPGVGVGTAAVLLVTVGDGTGFPSAAHLAPHAGLAPPLSRRAPRSTANTRPEAATASPTRHVLLRLRLHERRSRLPHLLRQATQPRQTHTQALLRLARQRGA